MSDLRYKIEHVHEYNVVRNALQRAGFRRSGPGYPSNIALLWSRATDSTFDSMWLLSAHGMLAILPGDGSSACQPAGEPTTPPTLPPCYSSSTDLSHPHQKANHWPNSWALGGKGRLNRAVASACRMWGSAALEISPPGFNLPSERGALLRHLRAHPDQLFILKPVSASCGKGIRLVSGAMLAGPAAKPSPKRSAKSKRRTQKTGSRSTSLQKRALAQAQASSPSQSASTGLDSPSTLSTGSSDAASDTPAEGAGTLSNKLPGKSKHYVAQRYIDNPLLINGHKFDMRVYVMIASWDPLRVYVHEQGLVRFATVPYYTADGLQNRLAHLTNYSVNKKAAGFAKPTDASGAAAESGPASKWALPTLFTWLQEHGYDAAAAKARIHDVVVKTLLSVEADSTAASAGAFKWDSVRPGLGANAVQVLGFDVMLDADLRAWLLEVNVCPSLSSSSPLDKAIKTQVVTDALHLAGFVPFSARTIVDRVKSAVDQARGSVRPSSRAGAERRGSVRTPVRGAGRPGSAASPTTAVATSASAASPAFSVASDVFPAAQDADSSSSSPTAATATLASLTYTPRVFSKQPADSVASLELGHLTAHDAGLVLEFEDELARRRGWQCVHPTPATHAAYSLFFQKPRRSNALLHKWLQVWRPQLAGLVAAATPGTQLKCSAAGTVVASESAEPGATRAAAMTHATQPVLLGAVHLRCLARAAQRTAAPFTIPPAGVDPRAPSRPASAEAMTLHSAPQSRAPSVRAQSRHRAKSTKPVRAKQSSAARKPTSAATGSQVPPRVPSAHGKSRLQVRMPESQSTPRYLYPSRSPLVAPPTHHPQQQQQQRRHEPAGRTGQQHISAVPAQLGMGMSAVALRAGMPNTSRPASRARRPTPSSSRPATAAFPDSLAAMTLMQSIKGVETAKAPARMRVKATREARASPGRTGTQLPVPPASLSNFGGTTTAWGASSRTSLGAQALRKPARG